MQLLTWVLLLSIAAVFFLGPKKSPDKADGKAAKGGGDAEKTAPTAPARRLRAGDAVR